MVFTYYGHSCFSVTIKGKDILFDPFITSNELAKHIDVAGIKADYIFLSHGHFDHVDDASLIVRNTRAKVIANWEIFNWCRRIGINNSQPLNPGGKWEFGFGTVHCVIAQHSNSLPDGSYGGAACGFVLFTEEGNFYYSGDTALTLDMKLIARHGRLDFAVLPIGDALTMGVEDAIELADWLGIEQVVGVHYDTFESIRIDHSKAKEKFSAAHIDLHLMAIGACTKLEKKAPAKDKLWHTFK